MPFWDCLATFDDGFFACQSTPHFNNLLDWSESKTFLLQTIGHVYFGTCLLLMFWFWCTFCIFWRMKYFVCIWLTNLDSWSCICIFFWRQNATLSCITLYKPATKGLFSNAHLLFLAPFLACACPSARNKNSFAIPCSGIIRLTLLSYFLVFLLKYLAMQSHPCFSLDNPNDSNKEKT